ncbi:hypothetical protein [Pseudomonas rubra]|uniref:Uncharacterized protein n=1 Tax=Pseudomonas rubra TaxID=2942627 RepID=A0ABT5PCG2_9PSED|nr:hypothetical protein [Pseudomonas rubra]MDD1015910.1 hypothetical protein [Pseudomonas rubra]MDD1039319.1 hypothetical protein [Pseudomonas rubra]MDD1155289.1 hypothetical protein [Pseudomonas rubra]
MSKKMGSLGLALAITLGASPSAMAEAKLFKDFAFDSPRSAYTEAKGYYDCSEDLLAPAMCKDDVDFIGHKFTLALVFAGGKLSTVSLISDFDQELYTNAMTALSKTFMLSSMSDANTQLDLIELANSARSRDDYLTRYTRYEEVGVAAGDFTYTFLEGADTSKKYSSVPTLLNGSADNIRSAELMLTGEGADSALYIRFAFPNLEMKKAEAAAEKPVESF